MVSDAISAILQGPTGMRIDIGRTSGEGSSRRSALAFVAHKMTCDSELALSDVLPPNERLSAKRMA